jgi:hypothetical protein
MSDARYPRAFPSTVPAFFSRHASPMAGFMVLAATLALGAPPAVAQPDVRVEPAAAHLGPLELVKSSLSRVLTIVLSQIGS